MLVTLGIMILGIIKLIIALGIMTLDKMRFGTMIFDIMMLGINTWHNVTMA
jgi:hypothetical protein